tara:strand:+ start:287 stop:1051 length:765 start_codon:yes stop_codon:yes gene_type:complete
LSNTVELLGVYGSDRVHACSAWTSTERELTDSKIARIGKLLDMLFGEGHHTPFEKSCLHFLVTTDIATHIHLLKHRIGVSINGESARYKELGARKGRGEDKYYVPEDWSIGERVALRNHCLDCYEKYHSTLERLVEEGYTRKRAKESARFYLPYATQITADVMFNFRSFFHFQLLRNSDHAQVEIREVAKEMWDLVERNHPEFSATMQAFTDAAERDQQLQVSLAFLQEHEILKKGASVAEIEAALAALIGTGE